MLSLQQYGSLLDGVAGGQQVEWKEIIKRNFYRILKLRIDGAEKELEHVVDRG